MGGGVWKWKWEVKWVGFEGECFNACYLTKAVSGVVGVVGAVVLLATRGLVVLTPNKSLVALVVACLASNRDSLGTPLYTNQHSHWWHYQRVVVGAQCYWREPLVGRYH
jgi:hypothetical protein